MKEDLISTRRQLLCATAIAGTSALAGCSDNSGSDQEVGRGREMSFESYSDAIFPTPGGLTKWLQSPGYSEVEHSIERNGENEGYANPGTLTFEIGEVVTDPQHRMDTGFYWSEGEAIETFEVDLEKSESTFTHKMSPGIRYLKIEGNNMEKGVSIDWYANIYRYYRDPSNLDCSQEGKQIELNHIFLQENALDPDKLYYDISYPAARLDSYDLRITAQSPSDETTTKLSQWSGECQTTFVGEEQFQIEYNSLSNNPLLLFFEIKDSDEVLSSRTIQISEN